MTGADRDHGDGFGREGFGRLVSFSIQADPLRWPLLVLSLVCYTFFGILPALAIRELVDAALASDVGRSIAAGVVVAIMQIGALALFHLGATLRFGIIERFAHVFDVRIARSIGNVPTLDQLESADYLDRIELLERKRNIVMQASALLADVIAAVLGSLAVLGLLAIVHPVLLVVPPVAALAIIANRRAVQSAVARDLQLAEQRRIGRSLFTTLTSAAAAKEVRIYNAAEGLLRRHRMIEREIDARYLRPTLQTLCVSTAAGVAFVASFAFALYVVVNAAINGGVGAGDVVLALLIGVQLNAVFDRTGQSFNYLFEALEVVQASKELEEAAADPDPAAGRAAVRIERSLRLEDVSFCYGEASGGVRNVNLELEIGNTVALVGEVGAGKSTIVKLLSGLYEPDQGRIVVDDRDLADIGVDSWRRSISAVFQDFAEFEFLASEVIGVGDLERIDDDGAVRSAASRAGATSVVDGLEAGFDTPLGGSFEGGHQLSRGQWQRMAIARGLMRSEPALLVLDEPSASLDAFAEQALVSRFAAASRRASQRGATTVLVTHRLSTARMADIIVMMHDGRVEEVGSHEDLVRAGGRYADIYRLQAASYGLE